MGTLAKTLSTVTVRDRTNAKLALGMTYASIVFADLLALTLASVAAVLVRHFFHGQYRSADYAVFYPCVGVLLIAFAVSGLYPSFGTNPIAEFRLILRSSAAGFLLLAGASFLLREGTFVSRSVFLLAWLFTVLLVPFLRRTIRGICSRRSWWGIPTVIIGEAEAGKMILDLLKGHTRLGLHPVAFLNTTEDVDYGYSSVAGAMARKYPGAYAVLAMPAADSAEIRRASRAYIREFRHVLVIPELFGLRSLSVSATDMGGVLALRVQQNLGALLPNAMKRCFDLLVSALIGALLLPLIVILYIAVRTTSVGPVFYNHQRIGKNGKIFAVRKFRSMVVNADSILAEALERDPELREEWGRDHKLRKDPRVTWVGRFLRKTSLDELPQIWNVISGDMSLVGPRPIVQSEIEKYGECYEQYILVRPGMTGLWQVSGRNNTSYELRTRIDDYYVRNWSLSMDVYILLRTLKTLFLCEGAY